MTVKTPSAHCDWDGARRKLTDEIVLTLRASDESGVVLARRYGVSQAVISRARHGYTFRGLPDSPRPAMIPRQAGGRKLTHGQVVIIKNSPSLSAKLLAAKFRVSRKTIYRIRTEQTWAWVNRNDVVVDSPFVPTRARADYPHNQLKDWPAEVEHA
jgi:hypothetical protein